MNADGEFRRIVGLGRFLASGAKATRLAGGQVDSRVSAFRKTFGSSLVTGGHGDWVGVGLRSRRRKYRVRGMLTNRRQITTARFQGKIQIDNGELKDDVEGVVEAISGS